MRRTYTCLLAFVVVTTGAGTVRADEVTDWNQTMLRAALVGGTTPPVATRVAAIVQPAVFDAVNGIARRYTPIHVEPAGPAGASRDAAAVQAAYATLVQLYRGDTSPSWNRRLPRALSQRIVEALAPIHGDDSTGKRTGRQPARAARPHE